MRQSAGQRVWGVRPLIPAVCVALGAGFLVWLVVANAPEDRLVAGVGASLSVLAAALLVTMRRRLTAGPDGLVIRGPQGARTVRWEQVTAITAPTRRRRGLASTAVELDLDDDGLIVLGKTELGADPADVAKELQRWWRHPGT